MRRVGLILTVAVVLLAVPVGTASARGDGWQFIPAPPTEAACGATVVHVTFPVDREYGRLIPGPGGSTIEQITGSLTVHFTTDPGGSVTLNISGPGEFIFYPNGDLEYHLEGVTAIPFTAEQAADLGLPSQLVYFKGLVDLVLHPDGSATPIRIPSNITDICAELGV